VCTARAAWSPGDGGSPSVGIGRRPAGASVGDGFPHQLGDIDDEIGFELIWIGWCANLASRDNRVLREDRAGMVGW
jgi:hypothetical protein